MAIKITQRDTTKPTNLLGAVAALGDRLFGKPRPALVAGAAAETISEDVWLPTFCRICNRGPCMARVHRVNGVAVNIEGNPEFREMAANRAGLCPKAFGQIQKVYYPYRIKTPLKRTNPEKGVSIDPKWVEISWDEALDTVAEKLKQIGADDPRKLGIATGGPGSVTLDSGGATASFSAAFGAEAALGSFSSAKCTGGDHLWGQYWHAAWTCEPDHKYTKYVLLLARHMAASGGAIENPLAADARVKGCKYVVVDPVLTATAAKADEWIPIKPGTDLAFELGLIHTIIHEIKVYDEKFLKEMTNSPYLVGPDGHWVRDTESQKPLVWDAVDNTAKAYDDPTIKDFALLGTYTAAGVPARPAFQVLKDQVKPFTPEWASVKTEIPAATIRRIAKEWVDNASIGSTITIDGVELPYRPVSSKIGRGITGNMRATFQEMCIHILSILVGALEVPGGHLGGNVTVAPGGEMGNYGITPGPDGFPLIRKGVFRYPFTKYNPASELLPFAPAHTTLPQWGVLSILDPEKLGYEYRFEAWLKYRSNLFAGGGQTDIIEEVFKKIPFGVSVAYVLDEPTSFADIVLPDTIDLEHEELTVTDNKRGQRIAEKFDLAALRQRIVAPLYQVKNLHEIFSELAERIGILRAYNQRVCASALGVQCPPWPIELDKKHRWDDITALACQLRTGKDLAWWQEHGAIFKPIGPREKYQVFFFMKEKKLRYQLPYQEHMLETKLDFDSRLEKAGIDWMNTLEYVPLPYWLPSVLEEEPPEYDFFVVNNRAFVFAWATNIELPWMLELGEHTAGLANVLMNAEAGRSRGIRDGDQVWVETRVGKTKGAVKLVQGIRPDTVCITGAFGHWVTPMIKDKGWPNMSKLMPIEWKNADSVVGNLQGNTFKAKVYKAEKAEKT